MFTKGAPNLNVNSERTIMHLEHHHHDSQDQARPNNQSSATGTGQEWLSKTNLFSDGGTTNELQQATTAKAQRSNTGNKARTMAAAPAGTTFRTQKGTAAAAWGTRTKARKRTQRLMSAYGTRTLAAQPTLSYNLDLNVSNGGDKTSSTAAGAAQK